MRNYLIRTLALVFGLLPTAALSQGVGEITLRLDPSEVAAIVQAMDRQPTSKAPPAPFWLVQAKIRAALQADPAAARTALEAYAAFTGIPQRAGDSR
ncbi:hypothetical protein [Bradyrhizobium sp. URHC0002]